jgi:hypothetical protein
MLTYGRTDNLVVECYTNADFAGDEDDRKSTSRYVYMLPGWNYFLEKHKKGVTATSTMQEEFVSCFYAIGQVVLLKNFILGFKIVDSISRPITMHCDNQAAVFFCANDKFTGASKHIDLKYRIVKERNWDRRLNIEHISTKLNIAYLRTKGLPPTLYERHVLNMGLENYFYKVLVQGH